MREFALNVQQNVLHAHQRLHAQPANLVIIWLQEAVCDAIPHALYAPQVRQLVRVVFLLIIIFSQQVLALFAKNLALLVSVKMQ